MIQTLGWIEAKDRNAIELDTIVVNDIAVVVHNDQMLSDRVRMLVQTQIAASVPSFLPATATPAQEPESAISWTKGHSEMIAGQLKKFHNMAQVTVSLLAKDAGARVDDCAGPKNWLRLRAAHHAAAERRLENAREAVSCLLRPIAPFEIAFDSSKGGVRAHCLVSRRNIQDSLALTQTGFISAGQRVLAGWSCALSGPFPVYFFANLGGALDG